MFKRDILINSQINITLFLLLNVKKEMYVLKHAQIY